ncbi:hypothetical protein [Desulfospira joergensenii]|uniref:hypothetical protein n=1 Tax=Desulfospira joergensenii TaxID=53329 RepID=UPI0003B74668|nr:hypothetical protein [Desulfospira joergensenii]
MNNRHLLWIPCFLIVLVFNLAFAAIPDKKEEQLSTGVFGIIVQDQQGKEKFQPTNTVPFIEGQSYGWIIKLSPEFTKVKWKEVFELPASPDTWGAGEASGGNKISEDRKVSIIEKEVAVEDGYIQNFWSVAPGDPLGDYVIRVYINDLLLETFHFRVIGE